MPPPPRARSVTPTPTVSPEPDAPAGQLVKRMEPWRWLGAILGVLLGGAFALGVARAQLATKADVEREHVSAAATSAALNLETQALRDRMTAAEVNLAWIKAQLVEIARATGAKPVPTQP